MRSIHHWYFAAFRFCHLNGFFISGIHVAKDAGEGVVGQNPFQPFIGGFGAVADDNLASMERVADADSAAVVVADPGGAGNSVEEGVENGPVGNGIGAVFHRLGFPVGRCHGSCVKVIAPDDDGGFDFAASYQFIE